MSEIVPRFEFRAFAQGFGPVAERIRGAAECEEIPELREVYLVSAVERTWRHNVKIRGGKLDIKELIEKRGVLERWKPVEKQELPLPAEFVRGTLAPALGIDAGETGDGPMTLEEIGRRLIDPRRGTAAAVVEKRRFRFHIDACPVEIDELRINGAAIESIAVESEDAMAVVELLNRLGLDDYENVSYPRAVRRIMGLEAMKGGPWYRWIEGS